MERSEAQEKKQMPGQDLLKDAKIILEKRPQMKMKNKDSQRSAGSRVERHAHEGEGVRQIGTPPYSILIVRRFLNNFHRQR